MRFYTALLPLIALLSLAGCGGAGESCPATFTACGGDLVGTWSYAKTCSTPASMLTTLTTQCPTATSTFSDATTGGYTFTAAGKYTASLTLDLSESVTIPISCLAGATKCDIPQGTVTNDGFTTTTTCTFSATEGCACKITVTAATVTEMGTYTTAGNNLTPKDSGSQGYCVNGSELLLADGSAGSNPPFTIFTKQ